jgi:hypothetical protein
MSFFITQVSCGVIPCAVDIVRQLLLRIKPASVACNEQQSPAPADSVALDAGGLANAPKAVSGC